MARRTRTTQRGGLDRVLPRDDSRSREPRARARGDRRPRAASVPESRDAADDWGATRIPDWLDTAAGRRAWAGDGGTAAGHDEPRAHADDRGADDHDVAEPRDGAGDPNGAGMGKGAAHPDADGAGHPDDTGHWDEVLERSGARDDGVFGCQGHDHDDDAYGEPGEWDDDWEDPPRRRFAMLPPAAIGLIGVGVIACVIAGFSLLRGTEPVAPLVNFPVSAGPSSEPVPGATSAEAPSEIVVSVAGLVRRPGLVRLPPNSRVAEALDRAGGARENADLLSLNLAQVLHDGDQVLVGTREGGAGAVRSAVVSSKPGAAPGASPGTASGAMPQSGKVNLNTATEAELDTLPGVGPVTAKAILAWRERNGGFASVDQLAEVEGIGPARLAKLRDAVTVG